ncbi:MAG: class A beta-lactamase-related serine hydrolase [Balneolaceae bacterium]|nr:MAG: class A beta-lactamase-related serine hydrolase [Balneolaceae bacterium]
MYSKMQLFALLFSLSFILACDKNSEPAQEIDLTPDGSVLSTDEQLLGVVDDYGLMGLSVVLFANHDIAYEGTIGYAVYEAERELTRNSVFRIASITKTVSSIALMQLVEQGLADIDDDISNYLGWELRNPNRPGEVITLRHLLGHTSGIRDGEGYGTFIGDMFGNDIHIKELFKPGGDHFTDDMFAEHAPGEFFSYSNASWSLVATVVELITGQRFDHYSNRHIFEPLGMNASFNVTDFDPHEFATLYRMQDGIWTPQVDFYEDSPPQERAPDNYVPGTNGLLYGPQGNLRIDTKSLSILALTLMHGGEWQGVRILEETTLNSMVEPHWEYDGSNGDTWDDFWMSYGLGIHHITNREGKDVIFPDRTFLGHAGIAYGLLSDMYVDPETGSGVIFITNGSKRPFEYAKTSSFYAMETAVFDILYPLLLEKEAAN